MVTGHSMQTTPSACLTVEAIFLSLPNFACSVNCCICCTVANCTYCVYQNHPNKNVCLPVSATLRSLLALSTSPCITASTTASSLTPARAPIEDQVTFHNEQKIRTTFTAELHYTLKTVNSYRVTAGVQE